jgi:hypothetical protein
VKRWKYFDTLLDVMTDKGWKTFTYKNIAEIMDCDPHEASNFIKCFNKAQYRHGRKGYQGEVSDYVIHRLPDTRAQMSVWKIGHRAEDVRSVISSWGSDTECRINRAIEPTLTLILAKNPQAKTAINIAHSLVQSLVSVLDAAVQE